MEIFRDRRVAGRQLAKLLTGYAGKEDVLVLGLPRGGVPVAFEVAVALGAPLDLFLVRKLGVPGHEELAMGAIASNGTQVLNTGVVSTFGIPEDVIRRVAQQELGELERREREYRDDRLPPVVGGRTVILVDDGLATGSTMRAAVMAMDAQGAERIVVAVPVAARAAVIELSAEADELVYLLSPDEFAAVGEWYEDFTQTTDEEVKELLELAGQQARQ